MARRSAGISGTAVILGTFGIYLAFVGVKDVPFFDGLRSLLRQESPTARTEHSPYQPGRLGIFGANPSLRPIDPSTIGANDRGIERLIGNAASAYQVFRPLGSWTIYGWGLRPDMSSDHPRGLALDIMRPRAEEADSIIRLFKTLPGAKYWIWNREIANVAIDNWRVRRYLGLNPHTDHVHLSFS